ncbi:MAG: histidine kinase [Muribaculaceae bacterium]|nr:histidine kinase [Muribaculaceae bacterium]
MKSNRLLSTATVIVLSIVLFYLPSILFQVEQGDDIWEWDFIGMIMATFYTTAFCVNYYWLVPTMLLRNRRWPLYLLINLCMVLVTMIFIPLWLELHGGLPGPIGKMKKDASLWWYVVHYAGFSIRDGIMVILASALGFAIRFGKEKEYIHTRELELNAERRQIELQSLKAQLNPHFLFNSLNNIYALIGFAPERAQDALHTLSRMLRFMIYDSSGSVEIEREANFIGEYVELMRLRLGEACDLEYEVSGDLPVNAKIAPLLYITLVENAFKHSSSNGLDYYIHISLFQDVVEKGKSLQDILTFTVENTFAEREESDGEDEDNEEKEEPQHIGVGLTNVRRQLNLLYPGSNSFVITSKGGVYSATIKIDVEALKN